MAEGARSRGSGTLVLRMAVDRGLIDEAQAREAAQAAAAGMIEPSTVLVTRGLLSQEAVKRMQAEALTRLAPATLGGYRVNGTLGAGGMGVVYRATQVSVDRVVALKVLDERMACQPEFADRFLREAKTAAMINSPHVVTVHDAGRDGEYLYLAMEIVTGGDVAGLMGECGGRLPPRRAAEIVHHAALGLQAIFAAGLIHRDIKPANIFLTEEGKAKLADLGLSRQISGDDRVTIAGEILGTPAFMSPEQAEGRELDIRSDIYSLGASLYSMLTGRNPFSASTPMATAAMVITEPFPDPLALRPTLPMALVRVINRSTGRRAEDRYQTPQAMADEMERVLDLPSVSNDDATGITFYLRTGLRAITPGRRGMRWPALAALAALLLASCGAIAWALSGGTTAAAAAATSEAARLRSELTARLIAVGGELEAARRQAEAAQDKSREFAAAAAHPVAESLAEYARTRRACWERYAAELQGDPALVALDTGLKTARALAAANPRQALAALAAADRAGAEWGARSTAQRSSQFERPLFAWCLDRGRERNYAPLAQARFDLGGFQDLARDVLISSRRDLAQLDQAAPVPDGAGDELALYAAVAGENDPDAVRWTRKLAEISRARARCAPLAQGREPEPADAEALAELIALVSRDGDALIAPAQDRLSLHQALLARLQALDAASAVPAAERLGALQEDLGRWVAAFGEGKRSRDWRPRLEDDRRWYGQLKPALEAAERGEGDPARADEALALAARIHAAGGADLARWAQAVEIARLRRRCEVFSQALEPADADLQALERLAQLVGGGADAAVAAAQAKLRSRQQLMAQLAELDPERQIPPSARLSALGQDLERWETLFGSASPRLRAWRQRLDLARRWGPSRQVLEALDHGSIDISRIGDAMAVARQMLGERSPEVVRWSAEARRALPWWPAAWARAIGSDRAGTWAEFAVADAVQRMRWIPPGAFAMGSPAGEGGRGSDEEQHQVTISAGFWLADSECTQRLWQAVTGENPSRSLHDPSHPVDNVSWDASVAFLAGLSQRLGGATARLPTEAEWEYACRAGASGPVPPGGLAAIAWYSDNSGGEPQSVKLKAANAWGLYDMLGNVDEWCADFYHDFNGSALADPRGPDSGSERVYRGGCFDSDEEFCRCARRASMAPGRHRPNLGLRIAIGASQR